MLTNRLFLDDNFFRGEEIIKSDVYERDGKVFVEMEAAGYKKDDIDISLDKGELTVTFEKKEEEEENKKYLHRERKFYSKTTRTFYLGEVNEEETEAEFKNGVLVISAPRSKKLETKKAIAIKGLE